jgi:hypothetical protein
MTRLRLALLLVALALLSVARASADCNRHCYSGELAFADEDSVDFSLGYTPCSGTADGQINNEPVTAFECAHLAGSQITMQFSSASYTLTWTYSNSSGCANAFTDARGAFAGALFLDASVEPARNISVAADGVGSLHDYASVCGLDCAERCFSFSVMASGEVAGSSPCGLNGTTECLVTVLLKVVPCSGLVTELDVLLGADAVPLSIYDPVQLASPRFECVGPSQLHLQAEGLEVLWAPHAISCAELMADLNGLATQPVAEVMVAFDDEMWYSEEEQTVGSALALSVCALVNADVDLLDDELNEAYHMYQPAKHPVETFLYCSSHNGEGMPPDTMCSIFGYENRNDFDVWTHRVKGSNWIVPDPFNRGQTRRFLADTRVEKSFGVLSEARRHQTTLVYWIIRHLAGTPTCGYSAISNGTVAHECSDADSEISSASYYTWNNNHPDSDDSARKYYILAGAGAERNDCSQEDIDTYCLNLSRRR